MKADLRRRMLLQRAALSPEARRAQSRAVAQRLDALGLHRSGLVVGYHPLPVEVDPLPLLAEWAARRIPVALPRIEGDDLALHPWDPGDELEPNRFGILEPVPGGPSLPAERVGLVLVPGVAFDRAGHRLGFGQGYYDRFLVRIPRDRRVGLAFDVQVVDGLPTQAHDVPMGWVVTPSGTFRHKP